MQRGFEMDSSVSDSDSESSDAFYEEMPFAERCPLRTVRQSMLYHQRFILKQEVPNPVVNDQT